MMWNVLIDRKGVNRIQTELLLRKAQSGPLGDGEGFQILAADQRRPAEGGL